MLASKRGRALQNNLTAYLFLFPAGLIIFIFGLFPVVFAFFVSLHRWRRFPDSFRGLDQYVDALGNLAFVLFLWLALGALGYGLYQLQRLWDATSGERVGLVYLLPAAANTFALIALGRWFFTLLPVVLLVPQRLLGLDVDRTVFLREFVASFGFPEVQAAASLMGWAVSAALVIMALVLAGLRTQRRGAQMAHAHALMALFAGGGLLLWLTVREIQIAIVESTESGLPAPIWVQAAIISLGVGAVLLAWIVWRRGVREGGDLAFWARAMVSICLLVAAYAFIVEVPRALSAADDDVLQAFWVTFLFAVFSVPLQLALGLGASVLLFGNLKAKGFFRVVFFLPYITPFTATSIVFSLIFSHREGSPANQLITFMGLPEQRWLLEPRGIFELITGADLPFWAAGPGLALLVIILYNVWVYAGYSTVIFLAGLSNIPSTLYEAARIDGANAWDRFRHITLPLLSPTTFFLMLIATIGTFQAFTQIFLLRRPGSYDAVDTVNLLIYGEITTSNPDYAYGSALAFVLFAVILILTILQNRVVGRRVFYG